MRRKMPVMVGRMAKDHFQDNFRQGGFVNGGLHPWPKAKRLSSGGFRCRQQLWNAALRQETSVQIGRIYTCRLPGKGIQRGGLCTHQQLGRGNRCHRHRPHEALCMGQVLQGFGKKKKTGTGQKKRVKRRSKPKELNPQAQFWRNMALTQKRNCTSASRSASSWAKAKN